MQDEEEDKKEELKPEPKTFDSNFFPVFLYQKNLKYRIFYISFFILFRLQNGRQSIQQCVYLQW